MPASCLPAPGSDRPWSCLPESHIIANCSWPHQGENVASLCIVTTATTGRPFTQRALAFVCICSCLVGEFPGRLFRHSVRSLLGLPRWNLQTTPRRAWGFLAVRSQLLFLPLSRRILLAETPGNTATISESLTTFITSFCCGFTCGYLSAPLML